MNRLTEYDSIRKIYRLKADCNMGENIQKLGKLEDRDEVKVIVYPIGADEEERHCGHCKSEIEYRSYYFCPLCGQRLKEDLHDI